MEKPIVQIVRVTEQDASDIKDLMCALYQDEVERWFAGKEDKLHIPGYDSEDMHRYHTWDGKYFKIMYEGSALAGVILISNTGREHGRIDRFYIHPDYQGKGIGSEALRQLEAMFQEVTIWTLDTTQFSPRNHHFYEKNGYVLVGEDESERYYNKIVGEYRPETDMYHSGLAWVGHDFRDSNFVRTDWYDVNMGECTVSNSNLWKFLVQNTNMSDSRFTNVNICNSVIGDARMENAEICHCSLRNLKISNCDLTGVTIDGISVEELLDCYRRK